MKLGLVAGLLFLVAVVGFQPAVAAQSGELTVVDQTTFVAAEGEMALTVRWTGPVTPDLFLSVVFHQPITDPTQVGETTGTVLNRTLPIPLAELPRPDADTFQATIKFRSSGPVDPDRVFLPESGTYPLTIEVRSPEGALASSGSHLIRLPSETAEIPLLPVAVIVPVAASASSIDGLSLDEVQSMLLRSPEVLFTIQLDDVVLNELEQDPAMAEAFSAALAGRPVITTPSFNLDPSALAEVGQEELFALSVERMLGRLRALDLQPAEGTIALEAALTLDGAELLLDLGFSQVLMVGSQGDGSPGTIDTAAGSLRLVEPDDELTELLTTSPRTVVRAYELLAVLATRYRSDPVPVILGGDRFGTLDRRALDILFDALGQPALFESSALRAAAVGLPSLPIRPVEQSQQDLRAVEERLEAIDRLTSTAAEFTGQGERANRDTELLASLSRDRNPDDRLRAVTRVLEDLQATFEVIELPETRAVTLTAVENPLPFTITNSAPEARTVLLEFRSDRVAVLQTDAPDAPVTESVLLVVPPGVTTFDLTVRAQSLGVSTLEVVALTPDRQQTLDSSEFRLRSTAVPNLGWLISGLALLFLVVWWFRQWRAGPKDRDDSTRPADRTDELPVVESPREGRRKPVRAAEGRLQ